MALENVDALIIATVARATLDLTGPAKVDGIGLNMVKSIRHWSMATKICDKEFKLTNFGKMIFSKSKSFDPYLEKSR